MGEGAGALVLETLDSAIARNAKYIVRLLVLERVVMQIISLHL